MSALQPETKIMDSDLLDALYTPARQGDFPHDSRAFVRIDTSLRVYWHTLFDICPELLELSGPDGLAIFRPFMAWAAERRLPMNWTYYLHVCEWLMQSEYKARVTDELAQTLVAAAAARWAIGDRSTDSGIVLTRKGDKGLVVGWKNRTVDGGREVERLELEEPLPASPGLFGYFTLPGFELNYFPGWQVI